MSEAKSGDTVRVHYTGRLSDGREFDSSEGGPPLEFTLGSGQVIPGFERAIQGMTEGDAKTVTVVSDDAYGPRHEALIHTIDRGQVPGHITLEVGGQLQVSGPDQSPMVVTITDLSEDTVTLDANHPLAGLDLTFELTLVEIV